jgi:hypothetical protein
LAADRDWQSGLIERKEPTHLELKSIPRRSGFELKVGMGGWIRAWAQMRGAAIDSCVGKFGAIDACVEKFQGLAEWID